MACCSSYHYIPPSVKHLTGRIQDSSPICVFCCRFATSTPRYSMKRSARDSARTLQDPWRGLSISSRNAWWVQTLSAHLWFILFSHSSVALCTCVYCFRVINQIHKKTVSLSIMQNTLASFGLGLWVSSCRCCACVCGFLSFTSSFAKCESVNIC